MPYARRRYPYRSRARPRYSSRRKTNSYATKRYVKTEIRKDANKSHPLMWHDVKFTGEYIKTTPLLLSLGETLRNFMNTNSLYTQWPIREIRGSTDTYRQADVYITGFHYQLRFQQNEEATSDVTTSTVRVLWYSHDDTYAENPTPIMDGGDIDLPPETRDVTNMYMDRIRTLKAGYTEGEADDTQFVPGQSIVKGSKKVRRKLVYASGEGLNQLEGGDIRLEMQSDDNSTIGEIQLYGFVRIYFRVME